MIKYIPEDVSVVFSEIPDEISLAFNISNCQNHCVGCHSPYLKKDIGNEITKDVIFEQVKLNDGITCICFMGEGNDRETLLSLSEYVRSLGLKSALYSGRESVEDDIYKSFDYVKVGPYIPDNGPLNSKTTNQRLYRCNSDVGVVEDITSKFWL